jgi:hypothetical protein
VLPALGDPVDPAACLEVSRGRLVEGGLLARQVVVALHDVVLARLVVAHGRNDALDRAEAVEAAALAVPDHQLAVEDGVGRDDLRSKGPGGGMNDGMAVGLRRDRAVSRLGEGARPAASAELVDAWSAGAKAWP